MVIMVDEEILDRGRTDMVMTPHVALANLLMHPFIQVYRYADSRPVWDGSTSDGAIPESLIGRIAQYRGYANTVAFWDGEEIVTKSYPLDDSRSQRADSCSALDLTASAASAAVGADIFVTNRDSLLQAKRWEYEPCCRPAQEPQCYGALDALSIVGLYLRVQEQYNVGIAPVSTCEFTSHDQFNFYWRAARALLPSIWTWQATGPESRYFDLIVTLANRIEAVLRHRDEVHRALNQFGRQHATTDAFRSFDSCVLLLMAALDVCARIFHRALQIDGDERGAAWQRPDWLKKASERLPTLRPVLGPGSRGSGLVHLVKALRNTVHT